MNVLVLTHRIPYPPDKGDKVRSYHWLRYLAARHAVHLATLVDDPADLAHVPVLERLCASVDVVFRSRTVMQMRALAALGGSRPLSVASFFSRDLARRVTRLAARVPFDVALGYSSVMAEYLDRLPGVPRVLDLVDVDSQKWLEYAERARGVRALVYRAEAGRLRRYEAASGRAVDRSVFVSRAEERLYGGFAAGAATAAVPNGVDAAYFAPAPRPADSAPILVFTGAMDYYANVDAVCHFHERVLPVIARAYPAVRFHVVGRNPARAVTRLARDPRVLVTGTVPDVRPYLQGAAVAVAPLRIARGIQNKILEAMAMALPVVTTSCGFEGLDADRGRDLLVEDDPDRFAEAVLRLLGDGALRTRIGGAARAAVVAGYDWTRNAALLETILIGAAGRSPVHASSAVVAAARPAEIR